MRILRLDGLRAVAVICVVLHHHYLLNGGWVGVELFFVLSGYLITGILRRENAANGSGSAYWKRFYIRRATRILPPALLTIFLIAHHFHPPVLNVLAYVFFLGNFASFTSWGVLYLGLFWSLAVEEHFYLIFPFAVRYMSRPALLKMLAAILVIEPVLRFVATRHVSWYLPIYFWTVFHLDGLAMGAMAAILLEEEHATVLFTRWAGPIGLLIAAIFAALSFGRPIVFERTANTHLFNFFGYSMLATTSLCLITYVLLHPKSLLSRILESRVFVFIGSISYGLYLYHQEAILLVMRFTRLDEKHTYPISIPLAILLSWLSFRFYEKPIIQWGHRISRRYSASKEGSVADAHRLASFSGNLER